MEPLDLKNGGNIYSLISPGIYRIDDPIEDSLYTDPLNEQQITEKLNRRLIWKVNNDGLVEINFEIGISYLDSHARGGQVFLQGWITEFYNPNDLVTELDLVGAIYQFYNQEVTEELINRITIGNTRNIQRLKDIIKTLWDDGNSRNLREFLSYKLFASFEYHPREGKYFVTMRR